MMDGWLTECVAGQTGRRAGPHGGPCARGETARVQGGPGPRDDVQGPVELADEEPQGVRLRLKHGMIPVPMPSVRLMPRLDGPKSGPETETAERRTKK